MTVILNRKGLELALGRPVTEAEFRAYLVKARAQVAPLDRAERRPREQGEHRAR